ncbi:MAG: FecR family protein, partial [Pirellulales bacterium]|nr:FecR family protein [Pirellulales bacterium]
MNSRISNDGDRFDVLCEAIFDGDASTDHITEFDALLLSDAALRDEYLDRCRLHTELAFHAKAHHAESATLDAVDAAMEERPTAISDTSPRPSSLVSRRFRTFVREHNFAVGVAVAFVFLSALLSVAHFTDFNWFAQRDTDQDNPSPVADREVATLTAWRSPEWVKEHAISPRDHRIAVGQTVALASGLIEITYDSGAKVVIEGPAEFVIGGTKAGGTEAQGREAGSGEPVHPSSFILHPSNSGYLALGKLAARCDTSESKGFAIATPNACVVDLGTEFGVEVDASGSEVAVLSGEVELTTARADGSQQSIRLTKDEGASVAAESGSVVRHETADVRMIATMRRRMKRIHEPIPDNLARIKSITGSHGGDKYAPGGFYSM